MSALSDVIAALPLGPADEIAIDASRDAAVLLVERQAGRQGRGFGAFGAAGRRRFCAAGPPVIAWRGSPGCGACATP